MTNIKILWLALIAVILCNSCGEAHEPMQTVETFSVTTEVKSNPVTDTGASIETNNSVGGGGTCVHSDTLRDSYHCFPNGLEEYVGIEKTQQWGEVYIASVEDDPDACRFPNIYDYIHDFDIPREVFETYYENSTSYYLGDYDIDLLYNGTAEEVENYYATSLQRYAEDSSFDKKIGEYNLKFELVRLVDQDAYIEWIADEKSDGVYEDIACEKSTWSMPEFVAVFNISQEDFQSALETVQKQGAILYEYDIDKIYNYTDVTRTVNNAANVHSIDASMRK